MDINRNNYEAYFIDYLEGNLDERLVDDFIEFLQQNLDLKEELALFETISAEQENILFYKKEKLYKEKFDADKEFDRAAIACLEGDISEKEKAEFDNYVGSHPEKQKDILLIGQTKLRADESIIFNKKNKLYHYSIGRIILLWSGRVAAIVILGLAIFSLVNNNSNKKIQENKIAIVENKSTKKEIIPETKKLPAETEKKIPEKPQKTTPKPAIKKVIPEKKSNKSLRETTKGRLEQEDLAMIRVPVETPAKLNTLPASLNIQHPALALAAIKTKNPEIQQDIYEEYLLADLVKEKSGLKKLSFNKISKAGLNLVANISKEKFTYETNEEGKITEYNYDSRLIAFSIPNKNISDKE